MTFNHVWRKDWHRKGQIEVTFNWIYVLIAGAVILLFFALIIVQQKSQSEENLASEVVRIMSSILSGAGVSENTKNVVDTSGIADYTLYFSCDESVGEIGIVGKGAPVQNAIDPLFAPAEIKTNRLITWSLPFRFPYKVMDLLMVTSLNTEYVVVGRSPFADEFVENTAQFTVVKVDDLAEVNAGDFYQIRVVDTDGTAVGTGGQVPAVFQSLADDKVTAVSFITPQTVIYFQKNGNNWEALHQGSISLLSFSTEKDPAKYAAIFAGNDQLYECNMGKVLKRLKLVTSVYSGKLGEMSAHHSRSDIRRSSPLCYDYISGSANPQLTNALSSYTIRIRSCLATLTSGYATCVHSLTETATDMATINNNLNLQNCLTLY